MLPTAMEQIIKPTDYHTHTISVLVENKFGVLSRVAGLFSGRGYNIHSLNYFAKSCILPIQMRSFLMHIRRFLARRRSIRRLLTI